MYELYNTATEQVENTASMSEDEVKILNSGLRNIESDCRWIKERNVCVLCGGINDAIGNCDCEGFAMSDGLS